MYKGNLTGICSITKSKEPKVSFGSSGIAFYISNHGFGHASRNIPIIRYILQKYGNVNIIVKTGFNQGSFMKSLLIDFSSRLTFIYEDTDVGLILKSGSLEIDKEELDYTVNKYISSFQEKLSKEKEFLYCNNVDLVVSDIVPYIFKATKEMNIKSMLVTNFTWVEIYKEYLSKEICDVYTGCYKLANKGLFYELYMEEMKEYIKDYEEISLCSRDFNYEQVDKIKDKFKKPIVYISVGRSVDLNNEIDVSKLPYDFIVTQGINVKGNNVKYLDIDTMNTQDYLMASDYIITKAGWGTISEVLLGNKKCALISRNTVTEDRHTIKWLVDRNLALEIKYEEFDIEKILKALEEREFDFNKYNFENDYKNIGDKIVQFMGEY